MIDLMAGAMVMAYCVAGLFFLRFWKRSRDPLFVYFSVAFFLLGAQRLALALTVERSEESEVFYIVRLLAFALIIVAIWHKNRATGTDR